jgi:hypothetical protein
MPRRPDKCDNGQAVAGTQQDVSVTRHCRAKVQSMLHVTAAAHWFQAETAEPLIANAQRGITGICLGRYQCSMWAANTAGRLDQMPKCEYRLGCFEVLP